MSKKKWEIVAVLLMLAGVVPLHVATKYDPRTWQSFIAIVVCLIFEIAGMFAGIVKGTNNPGPRPLIFVWTRGLVTGAAIEGDFTDATYTNDRGTVVVDFNGNALEDRTSEMFNEILSVRPEPRRMAYFTNDPKTRESLGENYAGSIDDLREFTKGYCRVARGEMLMRESPKNAISLTELQNLSRRGSPRLENALVTSSEIKKSQ